MEENKSVVHSFDGKAAKSTASKKGINTYAIAMFAAVVLLGIGTGAFFATKSSNVTPVTSTTNLATLKQGTVFGSADEKTFKDSAEGTLAVGGIEGEGSYHLVRPGGPSQYVYLTSAVLDLSQLVGKKIKVWGQTNEAQHAGWLMDVGRAQIL